MLVEKIIFTILAVYLLIVMFFKLLKKIDKIYIFILVMQSLSLILKIIEIIFTLNFNIFIKIVMYLLSIIIPIIIIILERKGKNFSELILVGIARCYELIRKKQTSKRNVVKNSR